MISMLVVIGFWLTIFIVPLFMLCGRIGEDRRCPECGDATFLVESRVLKVLPGEFEQRWCPRCGWDSVVRPHRPRNWSIVVEPERKEAFDPVPPPEKEAW